jgi:hypothetical protein
MDNKDIIFLTMDLRFFIINENFNPLNEGKYRVILKEKLQTLPTIIQTHTLNLKLNSKKYILHAFQINYRCGTLTSNLSFYCSGTRETTQHTWLTTYACFQTTFQA